MHELVFQLAAVWLAILVLPCSYLVLRGRTVPGRILALDTLVLLLIGILILYSTAEEVTYFLDAALLLALLAFIATLAAARLHGRGRLF